MNSNPSNGRPSVAALRIGPEQNLLSELQSAGIWSQAAPLRLHLGCGETHLDGYINIDYPPSRHSVMQPAADVYADIAALHLPDGSTDEIRLHHVFEHFSRVNALAMLIRWHCWLKLGGKLHIVTPDLEGCARNITANTSWKTKMGAVRHLAGDQCAAWAYHVDHWFPARFVRTYECLGFGDIKIDTWSWDKEPFLANVEAVGFKRQNLHPETLLERADELLWESCVADAEKEVHEIWKRQLRDALSAKGGLSGIAAHTFAPVRRQDAGRSAEESGPDSACPLEESARPLVSVIIPCFKQADFLVEALDSVIAQTFNDWECIVVNDGSPDNTNEVVFSYIKKYPGRRIRVVEKPNGGLSAARNFGVRHSSGSYVLPFDSDDRLHPQMLEKCLAALQNNPGAGIAYTQTRCFGANDTLVTNQVFSLEMLREENHIAYCSLYRREVFDQVGGYNTNLDSYEDWDFWIGALERGWQGVCVPEPLFLYRVKDQSMYTDALKRHDSLIARIILNHPGVYGEKSVAAAGAYLEKHPLALRHPS